MDPPSGGHGGGRGNVAQAQENKPPSYVQESLQATLPSFKKAEARNKNMRNAGYVYLTNGPAPGSPRGYYVTVARVLTYRIVQCRVRVHAARQREYCA